MDDVIAKLLVLCTSVPRGVVVFSPSFVFLQKLMRRIHATGSFEKIQREKRVFIESRETDAFSAYSTYLQEHPEGGAVLLAVIGGKLSEGINFSDDLGRCIVILGLPYPNKQNPIIQEKMRYLDQKKQGSGSEYYLNICLRAVNQAIGRAYRHKDDWAAVVFVDSRYEEKGTRARLTPWIEKETEVCRSLSALQERLQSFYKQFSCV